jgi:hypothetical protein
VWCYVAQGAERVDLAQTEIDQLRGGLQPILSRMEACVGPDEWRRRGSPILNLRIAPDGQVAEVGVDPHHYHAAGGCLEQAARGSDVPGVSLPGRTTVRCYERCVQPRTNTRRGRR